MFEHMMQHMKEILLIHMLALLSHPSTSNQECAMHYFSASSCKKHHHGNKYNFTEDTEMPHTILLEATSLKNSI